jgi:hypothetical protein
MAVIAASNPARSEHTGEKTSDQTIIARQGMAPSPVALPESRKAAVLRNEELIDSDRSAEMMVKIVKDYQNKAFDNIKVSLNAAIDHAKCVVEPRVRSEATSKESSASSLESNFYGSQRSHNEVSRRVGRIDESERDHNLGVRAGDGWRGSAGGVCRAIERAGAKTM